jgi:hypothetical protein
MAGFLTPVIRLSGRIGTFFPGALGPRNER